MARKKKEEKPSTIENSLTDVVMDGQDFPGNQGNPHTAQVSNAGTIFKNMRWYLISNFRSMLSQAYVEIGLIQTICDVPVDDALRGGVTIKSNQLSEEDITELSDAIDRDDDLLTVGQASKWNRLFGGAGVMVIVGDQDPELPLDLDSIGEETEIEFRAVDMWELFFGLNDTDGYDPTIQMHDYEYFNYYGSKVHKSRVITMKGLTAPSFIRPRLRGWGFSVVEILVRSINQYLKGTDLAFEVLDEFKVDIYKIKNLAQTLLTPKGTEAIKKRVSLANMQKNYQNAVVMDGEDDWDHKQLNFTGIGEAMLQIRMQVASDLRIPMTKLFGISASGFNSGEDDIEVYNAMVESQVRSKLKSPILKLIEIKCQQKFGYVPDDLKVEFQPLRVMGAEQEENVKSQKFSRLLQAAQAGYISPEEFRDGCNKSKVFDVTIDSDDIPEIPMAETDENETSNGKSEKPKASEKGGMPKGEVKPKSGNTKAPTSGKAKSPTEK